MQPELTPSSSPSLFEANSVASYENQGGSGVWGTGWGGEAGAVPGHVDFSFLTEPACENVDEDEDEDDYPNEGYL